MTQVFLQQNGLVTPLHIAVWTTDGILQDGGSLVAALNLATFVNYITNGTLYNVQPNDQRILVNLLTPGAFSVVLPIGATKNGPVLVKDVSGNGGSSQPITVTVINGETINGQASVPIHSNWGGFWFNPLPGAGYYLTAG